MNRMIFVFGSNTAGIHGGGAARAAHILHHAVFGVGYGQTGYAFAIPTKGHFVERSGRLSIGNTLTYEAVEKYIKGFLQFAEDRDDLKFQVTRLGCGLAGLQDSRIAPMFDFAPANCLFDEVWKPHLPDNARFWGTF